MQKIILVLILLLCLGNINAQCPPIADNMTLLDNWDDNSLYPSSDPNTHYSDVWGYVDVSGNEYAIIGGRDSIFIIDVTDPTDIIKVKTLYQNDISIWRDFKVYGQYLYSITDNGTSTDNGIVIYDLRGLPETVTTVKQLDTEFGRCHNIYIDVPNARLYAGGMPGTTDICVYDLTDPADPTLWDCISFDTIDNSATNGYYIHDLFIKDNVLYASHGWSGYYIWDMTNKKNITLLGALDGTFFDNGYVHSSWNSDDNNHAVVATEVGGDPKIYWVDQSNPGNIQVLDQFKEPLCSDPGNLANKRPHNPYIMGDKVFISFYHDGLNVLEIDFLEDTLGRVAYYDTYADNTNYSSAFPGNWGAYPYLPSGTILASDLKYGLYTLQYNENLPYTFLGPGTDWNTASNWDRNEVPPLNFDGKIIIASDCSLGPTTISPDTKIIVNSGKTLTY